MPFVFRYLIILWLLVPMGASAAELRLSAEERAWLAAHPVIRMGIDTGYGPYTFLDADGQVRGAAADFLTEIESRLGVRFELVTDLAWPQLMDAVRERRIDAVATVKHLPERDAFLAFSAPYLFTPLVILTRADAPQLRSLNQLKPLRLALVDGYSSSREVMDEYPQLRPLRVATPLDGLRAVASGSADAYVGVLGVNSFLAAQHGIANLKVNAVFDMEDNSQRVGVRKDWPQLAQLLDKALDSIPAERKNAIFQHWLPVMANDIVRLSQPSQIVRLFPWLLGALALALVAYLVILFWNAQLKRELARRRAELERAQSIAHIGDWSMDIASGRLQWSDELFRIAGRPPGPLDWPTLRSWIHPDDRAAHEDYLRRLGTLPPNETLPPLISHLLRPDGSSRWLEIRCAIEYDNKGQPCRYHGTSLDITERRQMEQRLREQLDELTRWQAVMLGREDRIQTIKAEVNALLAERGQPARYSSQAGTS